MEQYHKFQAAQCHSSIWDLSLKNNNKDGVLLRPFLFSTTKKNEDKRVKNKIEQDGTRWKVITPDKTYPNLTLEQAVDMCQPTYCMGQRFVNESFGDDHYILAKTNAYPKRVSLINLNSGNLWTNGVEVNDMYKITQTEFNKICANNTDKFRLLKKEEY